MNDKGQRISGAGGVTCDSRGTPIGYVSTDGNQTFDFNVTLELVKTDTAVESGTLNQSQTVFGIGVFGHEGIGSPNNVSYAGNVNLENVTCSVLPKPDRQHGRFPGQRFQYGRHAGDAREGVQHHGEL